VVRLVVAVLLLGPVLLVVLVLFVGLMFLVCTEEVLVESRSVRIRSSVRAENAKTLRSRTGSLRG
jgi:hypothetical protein